MIKSTINNQQSTINDIMHFSLNVFINPIILS